MPSPQKKSLSVLAPAKINLYLHITGRRNDGFHTLDSLVMFADIGDQIHLKPAREFSFSINGHFARSFQASEHSRETNSGNLVVRAAYLLAKALNKDLNIEITLTKNLPLTAGIGGGSSDAAATIRALLEWWDISAEDVPDLNALLLSLGADVPVCMARRPVKMSGIGEIIEPFHHAEEIPIVLVNPNKPCATADVFALYDAAVPAPAPTLAFKHDQNFIEFLKTKHNDLSKAAMSTVPCISNILEILKSNTGCTLSRMSGSGATCFGLFESALESIHAAEQISKKNPDWWVKAGMLNKTQMVTN